MKRSDYPQTKHRSDLTVKQYQEITDALKGIDGVKRITLFGSRAKGTHRYNSDVDILLTGPSLGFMERAEAFRNLRKLRVAHAIDVVLEHWIEEPLMIQEIKQYGIVLYDSKEQNSPEVLPKG